MKYMQYLLHFSPLTHTAVNANMHTNMNTQLQQRRSTAVRHHRAPLAHWKRWDRISPRRPGDGRLLADVNGAAAAATADTQVYDRIIDQFLQAEAESSSSTDEKVRCCGQHDPMHAIDIYLMHAVDVHLMHAVDS